ncbi:MAG TPA: lactate racemase domain-containing protein [Candidatus Bathyarchaeia archaeon]|nr:lactate racemase domain-containing protein [Candidatus Bathyarchaeia archaeon]
MPYGETEIPIRVPDDNFYKILEPKKPDATKQLSNQIEESLSHPINDFSLSNMAKPGAIAGVLIDPIVPLHVQHRGVEIIRTKLGALGVTEIKLFSRSRTSNVEVQSSSADLGVRSLDPKKGDFAELGKTSQGTSVFLEKDLLACDVRISLSIVTPHFASGFTGGPDILLPGASSLDTIVKNRSLMIKGLSGSVDIGENLVLSDAFEAYKMAGPFYSLTFVPDGWGEIDAVFSGELESVFREAVPRYQQVHSPRIDRRSDVVVVAAGKLLGMDLYHGVRVLSNAFGAVRKEGTIILVAECSRGIGDQSFLGFSRRFSDKKELASELRHKFKLGSHVSLFLQDALERHRIQLVSVLPDLYAKDSFKLKPSRTASSAIQQSIRAEGKEAKILIITRGDLTIPTAIPP